MHPILAALQPVADAVGGEVVTAASLEPGDVPVAIDDEVVGGLRLLGVHDALDRLVDHVERELGHPVTELDREGKRKAVHRLDALGAFTLRKAAEDVADRLEVSRFTIYNYLNAQHN